MSEERPDPRAQPDDFWEDSLVRGFENAAKERAAAEKFGVDGLPRKRTYVVHVAGPMVGPEQRCTRCNAVLAFGGTQVSHWEEGRRIGVSRDPKAVNAYMIEDCHQLDDDEEECKPE